MTSQRDLKVALWIMIVLLITGIAYSIECLDCHHNIEDDDTYNCSACHETEGDEDMPSRADAFHAQCKGCHEDYGAGPVECNSCHAL